MSLVAMLAVYGLAAAGLGFSFITLLYAHPPTARRMGCVPVPGGPIGMALLASAGGLVCYLLLWGVVFADAGIGFFFLGYFPWCGNIDYRCQDREAHFADPSMLPQHILLGAAVADIVLAVMIALLRWGPAFLARAKND